MTERRILLTDSEESKTSATSGSSTTATTGPLIRDANLFGRPCAWLKSSSGRSSSLAFGLVRVFFICSALARLAARAVMIRTSSFRSVKPTTSRRCAVELVCSSTYSNTTGRCSETPYRQAARTLRRITQIGIFRYACASNGIFRESGLPLRTYPSIRVGFTR